MTLEPILAEIKPIAASNVTLYTANVGTTAQGTIWALNQNDREDYVSVALVSNGNVLTSNCYLTFQTTVYHGQSVYLQEICLNSLDSIVVRSENGNCGFTFTGYKAL